MKNRASLKDVAKEAGVSTATVSYVINNTPSQTLTAETVERVKAAIQKLGYVPNMAARALVNNRSRMVGVVIPQTEPGKEFMFSNPFYGEFLSSVEYYMRINGYHIMISGTNADQSYLEIASTRSLDGIIIVGMYPEEYYTALKETQIPIVLVDSYCDDHYFHSLQIDDRIGGYMATKYLIDKGHRKIAHVTGLLKGKGVNEQRFLGYTDALEEAGIKPDKSIVFDGTVSYDHGIYAGELLGDKNMGVTAVFSSADIISLGILKGLKSKGSAVPDDVSVISFDDTWIAATCDPPLTVVRQDIALKGKTAAEVILGLSSGKINGKQDISLPINIVGRESVAGRC